LCHVAHHFEFLARHETAMGYKPLEFTCDHGFAFAAHIHERTRRAGGHFGHILE
jgi:hypothetical protein